MSYTVVGMFPTNEDADKASNKLDHSGFPKEDYHVSKYSTSEEFDHTKNFDYKEDEKTTGFWNWLFGEDENDKKRYSYAGTKSNVVTVYTDNLARAEKARDIMNDEGAINVNDFTKDRYANEHSHSGTEISADERARIISKAKNNLYFTEDNRFYTSTRDEGMKSDMDSTGTSPNTF